MVSSRAVLASQVGDIGEALAEREINGPSYRSAMLLPPRRL